MEKIFVIINGMQYGPYTKRQIEEFVREGRLNESTMCWYEGLPQWGQLGSVFPDVFAGIPPMPPVPQVGNVPVNPNGEKAGGGKGCCLGCAVILFIFLLIVALLGYFGWKYGKTYFKKYQYEYNSLKFESQKPVKQDFTVFKGYERG